MRRLVFLLCLLSAGCSEAPSRASIEGTVSFGDGQPLPSGTIRFLPVEGTRGAVVFAPISEGKYRLDADKGPAVGKNRIEITAMRKSGQMVPVQDGPPGVFQEVEEQYLPAHFNIDSTLFADIVAGSNKKDITLFE